MTRNNNTSTGIFVDRPRIRLGPHEERRFGHTKTNILLKLMSEPRRNGTLARDLGVVPACITMHTNDLMGEGLVGKSGRNGSFFLTQKGWDLVSSWYGWDDDDTTPTNIITTQDHVEEDDSTEDDINEAEFGEGYYFDVRQVPHRVTKFKDRTVTEYRVFGLRFNNEGTLIDFHEF